MNFDLAAVLRAEGITVVEVPGWQRRGYGEMEVRGVLVHHTATGPNWTADKTRRLLVEGRPDLKGPLCNLSIPRDGTVEVVARLRASHAGPGSAKVLDEISRGIAPAGDARTRKLKDDAHGNRYLIGLECHNDGVGEGWSDAQVEAIVRASAAILRAAGLPAAAAIAHREWTARKPDPHGLGMNGLRAAIAHRLGVPAPTAAPTPRKATPPPASWEEALVGRLPTIGNGAGGGAPNAHVRRLQALLLADGAKIEVDGRYGPKTLASVKAAQKRHKLTVDGIVGRGTWSALLGLAP